VNIAQHKLIVTEIKQTEFLNAVDQVNEVSYGNQRMIVTLYNYKLQEHVEAIDIADEASRDFHVNKYNMLSCSRQGTQAARKKRM
jgi:hypothetical protein